MEFQIVLAVIALSAGVLGIVFLAAYLLNRAARPAGARKQSRLQ
jgi:hypothetical protein